MDQRRIVTYGRFNGIAVMGYGPHGWGFGFAAWSGYPIGYAPQNDNSPPENLELDDPASPTAHLERERRWWLRAMRRMQFWFGDDPDAAPFPGQVRRLRPAPRTFLHPDDRLLEDIKDALAADYGVDARHITVTVIKGQVLLGGTVSGEFARRRAADIAGRITGALQVENRLTIRSMQDDAAPSRLH